MADRSPEVVQLMAFQEIASNSPQVQRIAQLQAITDNQPATQPVQKKENNTGLSDNLKTGIENLSGYSMDDVRVHHNSSKPAELNAHAYTQGTDIHVAPGQEKHLPHEAWHAVQQKEGRVGPTMQMKGNVNINDDAGLEKEADIMGQAALRSVSDSQSVVQAKIAANNHVVQREWIESNDIHMWDTLIDGVTWFAQGPEAMWFIITDEKEIVQGKEEDYKLYQGQKKSYKQWETLRMGPALDGKLKEEETPGVDKASDVVDQVTSVPAALIGNDGVSGVADGLSNKTVLTSTAGGDSSTHKVTAKDASTASTMGTMADSITGLTGIFGFVKGLRDATDPEKTASEQFVAFLEYEQGAMKIGESASKITAAATTDQTASKFGSAFEGFAAGFGTIKEAFLAVKESLDAINNQEETSASEKTKVAGKIGLHALETAKSAVLSIKAFYELSQGSASGALMSAVPGADIAISAIKLIMQGYYAIQSYQNAEAMSIQVGVAEAAAKKPGDKNSIVEAAEFYRKNSAMISNKKALISEDEEEIRKIDAIEQPVKDDIRRKNKRIGRIKQLKDDIIVLYNEKFGDGSISRDDVAEYALCKELKDVNTKRVTRQGIHIATEMTKIAGSIATLTGVGAVAGGAIKGAAAAVELALPLVRSVKQAGRSSAAREEAKLKPGEKYSTMFDTSKSDVAKKDFRLQQIRTLIKMAITIGNKETDEAEKDYEKLNLYLTATGIDLDTLFKNNGDPDKQISIMFKAITDREFF
ncbi:MAG: DUF4157 domain-containing protein [Bacteroidetes bacterium]|nr:DUF4157 domain-containing protein [Bacteroidota bacterium]